MEWYWWLIIAFGPLLGIAGGVYGTMNSVRQAKGPQERAFVIRMSLYMAGGVFVFLGLLLSLPQPWNYFMWIPYGVFLPLTVRYFNRRQRELREAEAANAPPIAPS